MTAFLVAVKLWLALPTAGMLGVEAVERGADLLGEHVVADAIREHTSAARLILCTLDVQMHDPRPNPRILDLLNNDEDLRQLEKVFKRNMREKAGKPVERTPGGKK